MRYVRGKDDRLKIEYIMRAKSAFSSLLICALHLRCLPLIHAGDVNARHYHGHGHGRYVQPWKIGKDERLNLDTQWVHCNSRQVDDDIARYVDVPRGGARFLRKNDTPSPSLPRSNIAFATRRLQLQQRIKYACMSLCMIAFIVYSDMIVTKSVATWNSAGSMFDVEKFKADLLIAFHNINKLGVYGLFVYTLGLAIWESFGLTTAFVETAAGMAFDLNKAIAFSFAGKFGGAILAFIVGRRFMFEKVKSMSEGNEILPLVENSIQKNPVGIAFMVRFFPFPELMKNLALSVTKISLSSFAIASFFQQLPFTIIWCLVGAETKNSLDPNAGPSNKVLQACVFLVAVIGVVGGPVVLALYLNSLKKKD